MKEKDKKLYKPFVHDDKINNGTLGHTHNHIKIGKIKKISPIVSLSHDIRYSLSKLRIQSKKNTSVQVKQIFKLAYKDEDSGKYLRFVRPCNILRAMNTDDKRSQIFILDEDTVQNVPGPLYAVLEVVPKPKRDKITEHTSSHDELNKYDWAKNLYRIIDRYDADDVCSLINQKSSWRSFIHEYLTDGLDKDDRLIDVFKAMIIPTPFELFGDTSAQAYSPHVIIILNSGTGKTTICIRIGCIVVSGEEPTILFVFGGYSDNYKVSHQGAIEGDGLPIVFDEFLLVLNPNFNRYLNNAAEGGVVTRPIGRGTIVTNTQRTIIYASNPLQPQGTKLKLDKETSCFFLTASLQQYLKDQDAYAAGRRIGLLLLGTDYKRVSVSDANPLRSVGDIAHEIITSIVRKHKPSIADVMRDNIEYLMYKDKAYLKLIDAEKQSIPDETIRQFVSGVKIASHKLNMATLKCIIAENLDKLVLLNKREAKKAIQAEIDTNFHAYLKVYQDINIDSIRALQFKTDKPIEEQVKILKSAGLSYRDIESLIGVSKSTAQRILNPHPSIPNVSRNILSEGMKALERKKKNMEE